MSNLTKDQEKAIRFYEGDVEWLRGSEDDAFWCDPKAYVTINSLFYYGIRDEMARVAEGKHLNPNIIADPERLLKVCFDIIQAAIHNPAPVGGLITYRVDRRQSFFQTRSIGETSSFTSTSKEGFIKEYSNKLQLSLLHITIPEGIPCIDLQEVLPYYLKSDEHEVLLPPFLPLEITEQPLTFNELTIKDQDGQPPVDAYSVRAEPYSRIGHFHREGIDLHKDLSIAMNCISDLDKGIQPTPGTERIYRKWKVDFGDTLLNMIYEKGDF